MNKTVLLGQIKGTTDNMVTCKSKSEEWQSKRWLRVGSRGNGRSLLKKTDIGNSFK